MTWPSGCVHTAAEAVGFNDSPAARRGLANEVEALLKGLGVDIYPVDEAMAVKVADAWARAHIQRA